MTRINRQKDLFFLSLIESGAITCTESGEVWNTKTSRKIGALNDAGYINISAKDYSDGKIKVGKAQRIVWMFFKGPIPVGFTPKHKNGDRANNAIGNLVLESENTFPERAVRRGRLRSVCRVSDEDLVNEVAASLSIRQVLLGLGMGNGSQFVIRERIANLGLDTSHFVSQRTRNEGNRKFSPEQILCRNSAHRTGVAKRTYRGFRSVPYLCKECGQGPEWRGESLTLIFDHINGDNRDHRPSNLRWLCPNCNSQTETFCGRNLKNPLRRSRK